MKRLKVYSALILVLGMLMSMCIGVFAAEPVAKVDLLVTGVEGFVYESTPHGFIVYDYDENFMYSSSLVNHNGVVISGGDLRFGRITEGNYLVFEDSSGIGIMDVNGNKTVPTGKYVGIRNFDENLFYCEGYNEEGKLQNSIVDGTGKEIVPPGKYTYMSKYYGENSHIIAYDSEGRRALLSLDGEVLFPAGTAENVTLMYSPDNDRYLIYDSETDKSYIRGYDGKDIAVIDGCATTSHPYLFVTTYDGTDWHTTHYDYNGNVIEYYSYIESEFPALRLDWDRDNGYEILDSEDNVVYEAPENMFIRNFHKGKFVEIYDYNYSAGLVDVYGNEVVPFGQYRDIHYCEELDIFAFTTEDNMVSIAKIEMLTVEVNGKDVNFADQRPFIKDGRTLVPLRAIFEALGAEVVWNGATRTATSTRGDVTVSLTIDSDIMYVNGKEVTLDVPATIVNDRTVVPVRAISEAFGCKVEWNGNYQTAIITG